jgi:hypothetical protein
MGLREITASIVVFLGLGSAVQNFFGVPLLWKLAGIAVSAVLIVWFLAVRLANWAESRVPPIIGEPRRPTWKKRIASTAVLGAICLSFVLIACAVVRFNTVGINIIEKSSTKLEFSIKGSLPGVDNLTIQMPPMKQAKCVPFDPVQDGRYRADVALIDFDTPNPHMQISNFFYPQIFGVRCEPSVELSGFRFWRKPGSIEVFLPDRRNLYDIFIYTVGGALWIGAIVLVWFRSR